MERPYAKESGDHSGRRQQPDGMAKVVLDSVSLAPTHETPLFIASSSTEFGSPSLKARPKSIARTCPRMQSGRMRMKATLINSTSIGGGVSAGSEFLDDFVGAICCSHQLQNVEGSDY